MKNEFKITDAQIADGCNEAYLKAGHNAYFGNGFNAGVEFALKIVNGADSESKALHIDSVSVRCDCNDVNKYKCNEDPRCKRIPIKNKIEICPYPAKYCSDCCFFDKNAR